MLFALAAPGLDAEAIELAILRAGHRLAWRALDEAETLQQLATQVPEVLLIADHPAVATTSVVGACDLLGVRSALVLDDRPLSAAAARLDLHDRVRVEPGGGLDVGSLVAAPGAHPSAATVTDRVDAALEPPAPHRIRPAAAQSPGHEATSDGDVDSSSRSADSPSAPPPPAARVIAVWGPAGAPGRTTLAIGLAAEVAARGHSVCLVDADTYGGTVAPALGLLDEAPGFAAACRLAGSNSLTIAELERVSQRARTVGELSVLTGIGRPHRWPELSASRVTAVLELCRSWRDVVIVDAGFSLETDEELVSDLQAPRRNAATLAALRVADRVVAVGAADPLGLARLLRTQPDLLEVVEPERVEVAVNRVRASVLGLDPHGQVHQTLERYGSVLDAVLIDDDPTAADTALLSARPVVDVAPRSALATGIRMLADRLVGPVETAQRKRLAWARVDALRSRPRALARR